MEKKLWICVQYLHAKFSHEEKLDRKKVMSYMAEPYMHASMYKYVCIDIYMCVFVCLQRTGNDDDDLKNSPL